MSPLKRHSSLPQLEVIIMQFSNYFVALGMAIEARQCAFINAGKKVPADYNVITTSLSLDPVKLNAGLEILCKIGGIETPEELFAIVTEADAKSYRFVPQKVIDKAIRIALWLGGMTDEEVQKLSGRRTSVLDSFCNILFSLIFKRYGEYEKLQGARAASLNGVQCNLYDVKCAVGYRYATEGRIGVYDDHRMDMEIQLGSGDFLATTAATQGAQLKRLLLAFHLCNESEWDEKKVIHVSRDFARAVMHRRNETKLKTAYNSRG